MILTQNVVTTSNSSIILIANMCWLVILISLLMTLTQVFTVCQSRFVRESLPNTGCMFAVGAISLFE